MYKHAYIYEPVKDVAGWAMVCMGYVWWVLWVGKDGKKIFIKTDTQYSEEVNESSRG